MKSFYIRWAALLALTLVIGGFGAGRYLQEVKALTPGEVLRSQPSGTVRVLGTVQAGSLVREGFESEGASGTARFSVGADSGLAVVYRGVKPDNLRELKTLVLRGRWDPDSKQFQADKISVVPNYRFVTAAYLVAILPLGIFLFLMERGVRKLFFEIKETTVYEPEKIFDNDR